MFLTQAYRTPNSPLKNNLYRNMFIETGSPVFEKITAGDLVNDPGYSYGFAWGDWDADGDLDIFTARTYNENENNSAFLNDGNSNKWLEIKLTGVNTNKSAIGTKVRVKAAINNVSRWLARVVEGQSGYCGQNLDLHFGLGDADVIDSIKVEWLSGLDEYFTNVGVNQIIRIVEGQGIIGIHQNGTEIPGGFKLYQNYPNPFNPVTKIRFDIPADVKGEISNVKMEMYNILGEKVGILVNQNLNPGSYEVEWNGVNFASGVYFYKLTAGKFSASKKVILSK
jgi:hypothetical protein